LNPKIQVLAAELEGLVVWVAQKRVQRFMTRAGEVFDSIVAFCDTQNANRFGKFRGFSQKVRQPPDAPL
jgi:hypothetical protein